MARASGVVADRFSVELAQKHAAGVSHAAQPGPRIAHGQAQVLARKGIRQLHAFVEVAHFSDATAIGE